MGTHVADLAVRPRTDEDLPELGALLQRQQPVSRYPYVWPFPGGAGAFLKRPTELRSWVALHGGRLVGHVAVTSVEADPIGRSWARAHAVTVDRLRCVSVLFADPQHSGLGVGSTLLHTATDFARRDGYPVLDVVAAHERPVQLYLRRGWRIIETTTAPWHPGLIIPIHLMILPIDHSGEQGSGE